MGESELPRRERKDIGQLSEPPLRERKDRGTEVGKGHFCHAVSLHPTGLDYYVLPIICEIQFMNSEAILGSQNG